MRWPFRYTPQPSDREGMEKAKSDFEVAKAIEVHADVIAAQTDQIRRANHLGPKIHRALGGSQ